MKKLTLLLFLLILVSCAPYQSNRYTVKMPNDWHILKNSKKGTLITKDGLYLQTISITERNVDNATTEGKKNIIKKNMLPNEIATALLADLESDASLKKLGVLNNSILTISGKKGCNISVRYTTAKGLKTRAIYYGLLDGNTFYLICYEAAERYYFEKDLPTFENMMKTFQLLAADKKQ